MKKLITTAVFLCVLSSFSLIANERDILFQAGAGTGFIDYGKEVEINDTEISTEYNVFGQLKGGYSFFPKSYITITIGANRNIIDSPNTINVLDTSFYGAGILYFPFETGIFVGGNVLGTTYRGEFTGNGLSNTVEENGFGGSIDLGYDFDSNLNGFSVSLNGTYLFAAIDDLFINNVSVYICLNLK